MKSYDWKPDVRALSDGTLIVPEGARIYKQHGSADRVMKAEQAAQPDVAMRLFNYRDGWIVLNELREVLGEKEGRPRKKVWYSLISKKAGKP